VLNVAGNKHIVYFYKNCGNQDENNDGQDEKTQYNESIRTILCNNKLDHV